MHATYHQDAIPPVYGPGLMLVNLHAGPGRSGRGLLKNLVRRVSLAHHPSLRVESLNRYLEGYHINHRDARSDL